MTLAYIAELAKGGQVAEDIGWFEMARSGGYVFGPLVAGWLLLSFDPAAVFTIIGAISCGVFLPLLSLPEAPTTTKRKRMSVWRHIITAVRDGGGAPAVWLTGALEAVTFIALYTLKAFLPIFALEAGISVALIGLFFSLNEAVHVLCKPFCGRLGDRWGYLPSISLGMLILAASLPLVGALDQGALFLLPAALMGLAQALIFPAAKALVSNRISAEHLGAGMGLIGMLQNFGKVAGPVLGGLAIAALGLRFNVALAQRAAGAGYARHLGDLRAGQADSPRVVSLVCRVEPVARHRCAMLESSVALPIAEQVK